MWPVGPVAQGFKHSSYVYYLRGKTLLLSYKGANSEYKQNCTFKILMGIY